MTKKTIQVYPDKLDDGAAHPKAGLPVGTILFEFDDKTMETFDCRKVKGFDLIPEDVRAEFLGTAAGRQFIHGGSQKVGDSYAGASQSDNALEYAKVAVRETIAQLYAGDWRATSASGPRVSDLARALARVTGKTVEAAHAFVEGLDDEQKKAWRAKAKVKAMLATIAAEKAAERASKLAKAAAATPAAGAEGEPEEEITIPE
jgi:hypothetical protein